VRFQLEVRWSWLALVVAYFGTGALAAVVGGHLTLTGPDGILVGATAFTVLAVAAALFHELGHALAGLAFGRRPLGLVLKAGAALRMDGAEPGSRGDHPSAESLVALGGPLASGLIGLAYFGTSSSFATPFAWAGLLAVFDGVTNLVPLFANSDGGRILHAWTRPAPGTGED
jgi:hypothetical protein